MIRTYYYDPSWVITLDGYKQEYSKTELEGFDFVVMVAYSRKHEDMLMSFLSEHGIEYKKSAYYIFITQPGVDYLKLILKNDNDEIYDIDDICYCINIGHVNKDGLYVN